MLAFTVIGVISAVISAHGQKSTGAPWPEPQTMKSATDLYLLADPSIFRIYQKIQLVCPVLDQAFARYYNIIFFERPKMSEEKKMLKLHKMRQQGRFWNTSLHHDKNLAALMGLSVSISTCDEMYPSLESSEKYTLDVSEPFASLTAISQWGALRGLETFSQLIHESSLAMLVVHKKIILDFPRFAHRGFLVDSSRHFLPVDVLLQFLGAYSQYNVYSRSDVKRVISYARDRGIRVIPEFDTPGHTQSWGSVKDLLTSCDFLSGKPSGVYGPINPILNSTYEFLLSFFREIVQVFPDNYIHVGGDEISFDCWNSNKDIQSFMAQMGYGQNYSKLEAYYEKKFLGIVENLLAKPIVWQEMVDNGVQVVPDAVVEVWKDPWQEEVAYVTHLGYRTLLSTPWYLNYAGDPYVQDWKTFYSVKPLSFNGTAAQKALVLGGEACMWGEYVDATNIIQRSWPRGCAVAERLWSAKNVRSVYKAAPRLAEQRCRMVRRGLKAEPVTGPGFCEFTGGN